ncbi:hypothetical protein PMN64_08110 [Bradyrhizobium sp. UFLA01-814]|uniref:hypothetical protein n=1 Tax=Bradyrhizobium sp. UFLA01-814 TaxID=3023480 RepID=UPI00398AAF23
MAKIAIDFLRSCRIWVAWIACNKNQEIWLGAKDLRGHGRDIAAHSDPRGVFEMHAVPGSLVEKIAIKRAVAVATFDLPARKNGRRCNAPSAISLHPKVVAVNRNGATVRLNDLRVREDKRLTPRDFVA